MINHSLLRDLVPLHSLTPADRAELAQKARIGAYKTGQTVFSRGERADTVLYLLEGRIELLDEQGTRILDPGAPEAKHPMAQGAKRSATGTALSPLKVLMIDRERLDLVLTWSQTSEVQVRDWGRGDVDETQDWMTALLQSPAFERIPAANIAQIFTVMQPQSFKKGEYLIQQGEPGDYYYIVTSGICHVLQKDAQGRVHERTRLKAGQGFGEEALVSGEPRNATVLAASDGGVMKLSAADFLRLLKAPLLHEVGVDDIPEEAILVDVRLPEEFHKSRLPGAMNLPLARLRERAAELDREACYVLYCDTGRRSACAAYLLSERGYRAQLLAGGVPVEEMPVRGERGGAY